VHNSNCRDGAGISREHHCWRSQTHISNRQFKSKKGEINILLTHACTIDLIPLVFEKTCFAGHIFGIKWKTNKIKQKVHSKKCIPEVCKGKKWRKPTYTSYLGRIPPWAGSRPIQELTRRRRSRGGPTRCGYTLSHPKFPILGCA
jgi:hypothetical protein